MAQPRYLEYDIYKILPQQGEMVDPYEGDAGTYESIGDDLGTPGAGLGDLLSGGQIDYGAAGVTVNSDTSADGFTPTLENLDYSHDLSFSYLDNDTVQWGSGTLTFSDGQAFSLSAGNTGNMAARTYIYFDKNTSTTELQTTTSASTAAGSDKVMIAVAQNNNGGAIFQVFGGFGGFRINSAQLNIANNDWTFSGTFSATDSNTVSWTSGTFTASDGSTMSIGAGNTGNMSAKTYIFLDIAVSESSFQKTTSAAAAVGDGRILVAVAEDNSDEAVFTVMNDRDSNIDAANIVAGSITANEIAAGTITASKMNVTLLSAIAADMGTITAGTITLDTSGYIRGGATGYLTGTGFFLGYSSSAYKFHVGNPSGRYIAWDGSNLTVNGYVATGIGAFGGDGSDGALSISSGTTTLDAGGAKVVVKNYTSISITGTAKLTISNKHANGTVLILKSQGDVTISSTAPGIDMKGMGGDGGDAGTAPGGDGTDGLSGTSLAKAENAEGLGGGTTSPVGGSQLSSFYTLEAHNFLTRNTIISCGSGGGGGEGATPNGGVAGNGAAGGDGGGALLIECGGTINFTGSINVSGSDGSTAPAVSGGGAHTSTGGGGGGGSCGMAIIFYKLLTSVAGSIVASGGDGGDGGTASSSGSSGSTGTPGGGGGGGGSYSAAGGDSSTGAGGAGAGGGGGSGANASIFNSPNTVPGGAGGADDGSVVGLKLENKFFA